jgi:hypothetical protein
LSTAAALLHGIARWGWLVVDLTAALLRRVGVAAAGVDGRGHGRGGSALVRRLGSTKSGGAGIGVLI